MKSFFTIIAILACWLPAYAQVAYESIDIKVDNKYQYVSEYTSSSIKKYAKAMKWLEANIKDFDNIIISNDADACKVEFKPEVLYDESDTKSHYLVANVTVECRDEKFRVKLVDINRKTVTKTCNYLTPSNKLYRTRDYNVSTEMKQYNRYKELSAKRSRTSDEARVLRDLKRYATVKKQDIIDKEMKPYVDLQKAIAQLIDGIENAIKGD